jgi:hypothetical protein
LPGGSVGNLADVLTLHESSCVGLLRPGAAVDAFLLKIAIEERLGYPVELVSDGLLQDQGVESAFNLSGTSSVYSALASGGVHIYPEARRAARCNMPKHVLARYSTFSMLQYVKAW